ncbi:predicted protein [Naegleria gruberi]|uniref:Predicted protein n=1 Tax=Naegleria gruberi TaxID=5762 RepID=D2VVG2_NAEGR|nr:uncharacterized protein NAEGRDRAFT_81375 [Naegleria gruberi]EFC39302.1 predicted protein [Naegleria gruberi]|eukprot:XP_002672046.1 predicted protein [Naegleria gruberi strain NEG-M]
MNQQPVDPNVKQEATYAQPPPQYDPNQQQPQAYYGQPTQPNAYGQPYPQQPYYDPSQQVPVAYGQPQPQYYTPQPVIVAQPTVATTTTTTVVNGVSAVGEGKQAEEALMFALLVTFVMWFLGIGFCFSCFFFVPVMKFRRSSDPRAKQYGQYGQIGFFITLGLNILSVVVAAIIIIAIIASYAAAASRIAK